MSDQDTELPAFPEDIPTSIGDQAAVDGSQNICLPFCFYWWNGIRWVAWQTMTFCGSSMEEIQSLVDFWLKKIISAWVSMQSATRRLSGRLRQDFLA